ncbi:MAG: 4-hydroxy-3-methylbut-2-enyl diphosphate reductase, partial [Bacteroidales bacterium]|nr:4-hydroxy-3-methylbut-2-enyl diphosphate reductase [Candidatus Cryptobacteroides faecihippi]
MSLSVEIEKHSGFCGGVIRAIGTAEKFLDSRGQTLYSLGSIVHNEAELKRLGRKGLVTIEKVDLIGMAESGQRIGTLLIRAHGEPPQTYSLADRIGGDGIDCTCPVVLHLQKSIRESYERLRPFSGQRIIFGKIGPAEVLGLLGQVDGDALVIENMNMLEDSLLQGRCDVGKPVEIFSQTTKCAVVFAAICEALRERMEASLEVVDTMCSE